MESVLDSSKTEQANQYLEGVCAESGDLPNSNDGEVGSKQDHICNTCGKKFTLKKNLNQHLLTHSGNKWYKCDICEKPFSRSSDVVRHRRIHESKRVFICNICGKVLSCSYCLNRHIRTHKNKKVYNCVTCSETFSKRSDLMMHAKIHPKKTYKCDICEKTFQCNSELLHHVSVSHNKIELQSVREKPRVNDGICEFSKNITYTRGASALNVFSTHSFSPSDEVSGDLVCFFEEFRSGLIAQIQEELYEKSGLKWYIVVKILLHRTASDGEEEKVSPSFRSVCVTDTTPDSVSNHVEAAFAKIHSSFAEYTSQGCNWVIDKIIHMELSCAKYNPVG